MALNHAKANPHDHRNTEQPVLRYNLAENAQDQYQPVNDIPTVHREP